MLFLIYSYKINAHGREASKLSETSSTFSMCCQSSCSNSKIKTIWLCNNIHRVKERDRQRERLREVRREEKARGSPFYSPNSLTPNCPYPSITLVSYFSRNVVTVNGFLLKKHVKTALVLGQGVTCNSIQKHRNKHCKLTLLILKCFSGTLWKSSHGFVAWFSFPRHRLD